MIGITLGALVSALALWLVARPVVRAKRRHMLMSNLSEERLWLKREAPGAVSAWDSEIPEAADFAHLCYCLDRASRAVSDERDGHAAQLMLEARERLLRLRDSEIGKRHPLFAISLENTRVGELSKRVMALAVNSKRKR